MGACYGHPLDPGRESYEGDLDWPTDDEDAEYEAPMRPIEVIGWYLLGAAHGMIWMYLIQGAVK